jgi:hypothetical protein
LVWCVRKPGRDLRDKVELLLAWRRVQRDVREGVLGADFERADHQEIQAKVALAEDDAKDEVWAGYRFVVLADGTDPSGLKVIDLGAGHSSASETLCGWIIAALKAEALLNESVGAGYIDRNWPPAFKDSGAWPLASLRQSFLNGALTRLLDPDGFLKTKLVEFVGRGEFGLASGPKPEGGYERLWFSEPITSDEIAFESGVVLLKKAKAEVLNKKPASTSGDPKPRGDPDPTVVKPPVVVPPTGPTTTTIKLSGNIPTELWNRLGTRVLPKLRTGKDLKIGIDFSVTVEAANANDLQVELKQILTDLGLQDSVELEQS